MRATWLTFLSIGPLAASEIELTAIPSVVARWGEWREQNPHTTVVTLETGHRRNYEPGAAYGGYFASPEKPQVHPTVVDVLGPEYAPRTAEVHIDAEAVSVAEFSDREGLAREVELSRALK